MLPPPEFNPASEMSPILLYPIGTPCPRRAESTPREARTSHAAVLRGSWPRTDAESSVIGPCFPGAASSKAQVSLDPFYRKEPRESLSPSPCVQAAPHCRQEGGSCPGRQVSALGPSASGSRKPNANAAPELPALLSLLLSEAAPGTSERSVSLPRETRKRDSQVTGAGGPLRVAVEVWGAPGALLQHLTLSP